MSFVSEYVYNNIKLNKAHNAVENTLLEYERKYGFNYNRVVKVQCVTRFLDKLTNKTKIIPIESYNIIGKVNKIMQSSKGM